MSLFNLKKALSNITKNEKFSSRIQTFFLGGDLCVDLFSNSPKKALEET